MRYYVTLDGTDAVIEVEDRPDGGCTARRIQEDGTAESPLEVDARTSGGSLVVRIGGRVVDVLLDGSPPTQTAYASGRRAPVSCESERMRATGTLRSGGGGRGSGTVLSPMPGRVVKVLVAEGAEVEVGAPLVVVEAMKMENELRAERSGVVKSIHVAPGDAVEGGARLVTVA